MAEQETALTKEIVNIIYYELSSIKVGGNTLGLDYPDLVYFVDTKTPTFVSRSLASEFNSKIYYDVNRNLYYDGVSDNNKTLTVMKKTGDTQNVSSNPMITIGGITDGELDSTKAGLLCARDV